MIFLLLSICCSSLIFVLFRMIGLRNLDTFHVIVINYITAALFGFFILAGGIPAKQVMDAPWFGGAALLGTSFIFVFYLMAITTQRHGTGIAVIANKMSLVIPVVFAFIFYGDDFNLIKITGILTAIVGVYLSLKKPADGTGTFAWLPVVLFVCSGFIDVGIKHVSNRPVSEAFDSLMVPTIFMFAFFTGSIALTVKAVRKGIRWNLKLLLFGIVLGVVNFFSIHFLVKALSVKEMQTSVVFPLNNISIVLLSTFLGMLLFREKLNSYNRIGIILSVVAILLISYSR